MCTGDDADGLHAPSVSLSEHGKKETKRKRGAKWSPDETIILLQSLRDLVHKCQAEEQCAKGSDKWEHISQELSHRGRAPRAAKSVAERWDTLRQAYLCVEDHLKAGKDFPQALRESRKEFKFLPAEYTLEWHALAAGCGPTHKKKKKDNGAELASVEKTPANQKLIDATPCKVTPGSVPLETFTQAFHKHIRSVESLQSRSRDPASASQRCDETDEPGDIVTSLVSLVGAVETLAKCEKSDLYYFLKINKLEWKLVQDRASSLLEDQRRKSRPTSRTLVLSILLHETQKKSTSGHKLDSKEMPFIHRDANSNLEQALERFQGFVYPQNDLDPVTITQEDMRTLNPSEFLNDTIIDFYNKYLLQTLLPRERLHTLHVFNSFFFLKLVGIDTSYKVQSRVAFERVKKWTMKISIFEKDYIIIPVNQRSHWSLIIICHPGRICDVDGPSGVFDVGDPCILHLDSHEGYHTGLKDCIKNYLSEEWKEQDPNADARGYFDEMHFISAKVPQQENNYDCGIFMLHYLELFLKVAPPKFNLKSIRIKDPNFLRKDWFKPSEASAKRPFIQQLIVSISQGESAASLKNAQEPSNFEANGELAGVNGHINKNCNDEKPTSLECEHNTHNNGSDLFAERSQLLGPQTRERTHPQEKEILAKMQAKVTRSKMLVGSRRGTPPLETHHGEVGPSMREYEHSMASTSGPHDMLLQIPDLLIKNSQKCLRTKIPLPNGAQWGAMLYYIHQGDSLLLWSSIRKRSTFYMLKDYMHGIATLQSSWQMLCERVNTSYDCQDCKPDGKDSMCIVEATSTSMVICDVLNSQGKPKNFKAWSILQNIKENIKDILINHVLLHPNLNIVFWATICGVVGAYDFQSEELIGKVHLPQGFEPTRLIFSIALNMLVVSTCLGFQEVLFTWTLNDEQVEMVEEIGGFTIGDLHNDQVRLLVHNERGLAIYDLQQRKELHRWTGRRVQCAKYSCDGQLVYAVFGDSSIRVFDATCLQLRCRITPSAYAGLNTHVGVGAIAVHPRKRNQFAIISHVDQCIYVVEPSEELEGEWVCKAN